MSSLPPSLPSPQPIPKQGLSGCAVAAIVVGVVVLLGVIVVGAGGYWIMQKAGGRSGVAKAAIGMANPDYEIIKIDDTAKSITVRHRKTGKTATFPMSHMKDGRVDPAELGLSRAEAEGTGSAPEWVKYPNARLVISAHVLGMTTLVYETSDSFDHVMQHYKSILGAKGAHVTTDRDGALVVNDDRGSLKVLATGSDEQPTTISIEYRAK